MTETPKCTLSEGLTVIREKLGEIVAKLPKNWLHRTSRIPTRSSNNLGSRQPRNELVWLRYLTRLETHLGNFIRSHRAQGLTLTRLCEIEEETEQKNIDCLLRGPIFPH